jgi:hypothetical protein
MGSRAMSTSCECNTMRIPILAAVLLGLAGLPRPAHARVGEAEVRAGPLGGPCFTISPREERLGTPDFQALSVTDGRRPLWKLAMPPGRSFTLNYAMCVPYGGRVASLPQAPAAELEPGKVYYLRIDSRPVRGAGGASAYEARFCLAKQRDGSAIVHQIWNGEGEGRRLFGCLPPD